MQQSFEKLKQSPIFAMSLSSKELFHSNFWAWLIEHNNEYATVFFDDIDYANIKPDDVKREEKNRDLTIHVKEKAYIIENKLKSLPNEEQLKKYQDGEKAFVKGCLTGVVKPNTLPCGWVFKSYKNIGNAILKINEKNKTDKWHLLIQEYAEMITEIDNTITAFNASYGQKLISWAQYGTYPILNEFERIRFADICKKSKANEFVEYLNKTLKDKLEKSIQAKQLKDVELCVYSSFADKSSIVDVRFVKNKDSDKQVVVGIQIQDSQYRFGAERKSGTLDFGNPNALQILFDEFEKFGWFEKYDKKLKTLKNRKTSMGKSFDCYAPAVGPYKFVYQYYTLNENDLIFENLASQIEKDMLFAIEIVSKLSK